MRRLSRLLAAVLAFGAAQGVWAADQYWVGGASGLWGDDNWADAADGTGAAWTNGSRSVFTTTPAAIDLAGFSPTATYLTGSGFSDGNLCEIAVTNASETVPTLTLTSAASDFTVASFSNVNVHCTATGNFGLNNSSHLYFGEGSKFTMAGGGRFLVGNSISCSNSLVVAAGAEATVSKALWIGCGSQNSLHPIGVVHVAGGDLIAAFAFFPFAKLDAAGFPDAFEKFAGFATALADRLDRERHAPSSPPDEETEFHHPSSFLKV